MELEEIFLASLTGAQDAATWQRRLAAAIRRLAGDDATLCCLPFGFEHFDEMKRYFEPRLTALRQEHLNELAAASRGRGRTAGKLETLSARL